MSKTKQRKNQAYYEGLKDGKKGLSFGYKRHPYMSFYKKGYNEGRKHYKEKTETPVISGYDDL